MSPPTILGSWDAEIPNSTCSVEVAYDPEYMETLTLSFHYQSFGDFWGEHYIPTKPEQLREIGKMLIEAASLYEERCIAAERQDLLEEEGHTINECNLCGGPCRVFNDDDDGA